MSETASAPARERDLRNLLFDMEEDVLTVLGFFHAISAMGNSTLGLGPEQTNGLLRVAIAGLHSATALKEKWLAAFELAAAQREEAPMRERDTTQASDALTGAFWRAWGEYQFRARPQTKNWTSGLGRCRIRTGVSVARRLLKFVTSPRSFASPGRRWMGPGIGWMGAFS